VANSFSSMMQEDAGSRSSAVKKIIECQFKEGPAMNHMNLIKNPD